MEQALRALLMGTAPIAALVGTRIDWGLRSQGAPLPGIAMHRISGVVGMTMAGPSGWSRDRVQIDCWGRTFADAKAVADLMGARGGLLVGFRGARAGVRLRTFVVGRHSNTGTDDDRDGAGPAHRASLDVMIWHDG